MASEDYIRDSVFYKFPQKYANIQWIGTDSLDHYSVTPCKIFGEKGKSRGVITFQIKDLPRLKEVLLYLNHCCTSDSGVISISVNNNVLHEMFSVIPKIIFSKQLFGIPAYFYRQGDNTMTIMLHQNSKCMYLLRDMEIEFVYYNLKF